MVKIINQIRAYMTAHGKTQEQMADLIGVKRSTLSLWLLNHNGMNAKNYIKVVEFFSGEEKGENE